MARSLLAINPLSLTPEMEALLIKSVSVGYLEYRDTEFPSIDEYRAYLSDLDDTDQYVDQREAKEERYRKRNEGGSYHEAVKLKSLDLIESDIDAWHVTFRPTETGIQLARMLSDMKQWDEPVSCLTAINMQLALTPADRNMLELLSKEPVQFWRCPKAIAVLNGLSSQGLVMRTEDGFKLTTLGARLSKALFA